MKFYTLNLICLSLTLLSACGHKGTAEDARNIPIPELKALKGTLGEALREIQGSRFAEDCDQSLANIKTELVAAVIEKEKDLSQGTSTHPDPNAIKFAGSYLRNLPRATPTSTDWDAETYGWQSVYDYYQQNKDQGNPRFWNYVNSDVRSLVVEDQRRVIYGVNGGINHSNVGHLDELEQNLTTCVQDNQCLEFSVTPNASEALRKISMYHYFWKKLESASLAPDKRDVLARFLKRVQEDNSRVTEKFNAGIKIKKDALGTHLSLAVDASDFSTEDQTVIKNVIESVWKTEGTDLILGFLSRLEDSTLFKILFHLDRPGERFYVSRNERTLNLFPAGRVRPISHEFGHVLGFSDHYYTVWDQTKCAYRDESNQNDLMSSSSSGVVTAEEWKKLLGDLNKPQS